MGFTHLPSVNARTDTSGPVRNSSITMLLPELPNIRYNYGYFPIFVDEAKYGMSRDALYEKLKANNIYGRRYFYPLISTLNPYKKYPSALPSNLPVATKMANQVLCLPMHHELTQEDVERIIDTI